MHINLTDYCDRIERTNGRTDERINPHFPIQNGVEPKGESVKGTEKMTFTTAAGTFSTETYMLPPWAKPKAGAKSAAAPAAKAAPAPAAAAEPAAEGA